MSLDTAVNKLLDLVERTTGKLDPKLPDTPETRRALLNLFDAMDRRL